MKNYEIRPRLVISEDGLTAEAFLDVFWEGELIVFLDCLRGPTKEVEGYFKGLLSLEEVKKIWAEAPTEYFPNLTQEAWMKSHQIYQINNELWLNKEGKKVKFEYDD